MKKICLILLVSISMIFSCFAGGKSVSEVLKGKEGVFAVMDVSHGTIVLELFYDKTPLTVTNFVGLAEGTLDAAKGKHFYDGLTFHRIIDGFMIQGGDPTGTGFGGSNKKIKGEFSANGFENDLKHERGVISMARASNSYDSASSQFFIVQTTYPSLNGLYAAFGKVTSGMDIVDQICKDTPVEDNNGTVLPENQPKITNVYIVE